MANDLFVHLKIRYMTEAEWLQLQTPLQEGEFGFASDNQVLKVGNGVSAWQDLDQIKADLSEYLKTQNFRSALENELTDEVKSLDGSTLGFLVKKNP